MAKILLAHPLFLSQNADEMAMSSPYFPLGLLYLAGYVREKGHAVAIFDGTFEADDAAFAERLAIEKPDIVGISALITNSKTALKLAQMAQDAGIIVLLGGPDPTKDPAAYMQFPQVDLVAHHEGEQTLVALLNQIDKGGLTLETLSHELGIAFRHNGQIIVNAPRPPIDNLDTLPLPARDLIDMDRYLDTWQTQNGYSSMTITTSRGCPYGCDWCAESVHGTNLRQRSPESVAAEMKLLKETYKIDRLRVVDDVDGLDRAWIEAWANSAETLNAVIPFEALYDLQRQDLPMLEVRDSL
ncbi:MAG: B12-binding domain-containing radical SAM protein [Candidatus Promineifilaceae bacterium]